MKLRLLTLLLLATADANPAAIELHVLPEPVQREVPRVGLNLGLWTSWGAEQLSANVLKNPGFEGGIDGAIIITGRPLPGGFEDDTPWLARPEGFWNAARYEILSGRLQGRSGTIVRSGTYDGRARFAVKEPVTELATGDVITINKRQDQDLPSQWWTDAATASTDDTQARPGSAGIRSLRLRPQESPAAAISYLDAIGERAGKLLPLRGEWIVSISAKTNTANARIRVKLHRSGSPSMLDETVTLTESWQALQWTIRPAGNGPAGTLELRFEAIDPGSTVWLDDAAMHSAADHGVGFREEVVETLRTLRPGYLRDWQGQLGDTLENRLAPPFARRSSRYRPGGSVAVEFHYGLPEFLELCHAIGAQPWVVLAPTMTETEWREAGRYLRSQQRHHRFREILVEFGNENWNPLFRPAGIQQPAALSAVAARAFTALAEGAGNDFRIRPVLGGNVVNSGQIEELAAVASANTVLAVAPYWAYELRTPADFFPAEPVPVLGNRNGGREMAIYEMNAHSLGGQVPPAEADRLLESAAAGSGLLWNVIGALQAGVRRICVYTLAGFDTHGNNPETLVRLFGITRDLSAANQFRPNGLALVELNNAIAGDLHPVESSSAAVRLAAFHTARTWTLVAVSRSSRAESVRIHLPTMEGGDEDTFDAIIPAFGHTIAHRRIRSNER